MKHILHSALCALALTGTLLGRSAFAQEDKTPNKPKPAPIIIRAQGHTAHLNDFMTRMSKDRGLAAEVKSKGMDRAYTEWMQRDHPYVFAKMCINDAGKIATDYKGTKYMQEFDAAAEKSDDRSKVVKEMGHDLAFADWLRHEYPDEYLHHFGIKPEKKSEKNDKHDVGKTN